jgi:hypothetical protein
MPSISGKFESFAFFQDLSTALAREWNILLLHGRLRRVRCGGLHEAFHLQERSTIDVKTATISTPTPPESGQHRFRARNGRSSQGYYSSMV